MAEYLRVLDLDVGSGVGEIREAFRQQTRAWDPDQMEHDPRLKAAAERQRKDVRAAYEWLTDNADMVTASARKSVPTFKNKSKSSGSGKSLNGLIMWVVVVGALLIAVLYFAMSEPDPWLGPLKRL